MFEPIQLRYNYADLEPYIDSETMKVHYNNHYLGYLKKLNEQVELGLDYDSIEDLIKNILFESKEVRDNAGGYYNHSLFFNMLKPPFRPPFYNDSKQIPKIVLDVIKRDFGSLDNFKKKIEEKAQSRFGSGWVWWILLPNGKTQIIQTPYQDNPAMFLECKILLGVDVWEHAYYLKYKSNRSEYVKNIFNVINWGYPKNILEENL
jgi:Fe-Mn family superoxide dismutase